MMIQNDSVSSKPLFDWFAQNRDNRAKLRAHGYTHGRITNWKRRGIPLRQVGNVAELMGITYEQYLSQAVAATRRKDWRRAAVLATLALMFSFFQPEAAAGIQHNNLSDSKILHKSFTGLHILCLLRRILRIMKRSRIGHWQAYSLC